MKKIILISFILFALFFNSSCEVESVKNDYPTFFDLNDFLEKEISQLSDLKSIKKRVRINDSSDEQILGSFDLKKDLEIFRNANINKITWLDKYQVDSTFNLSNQLEELTYTALDKKLKTRVFIVKYTKDKVSAILIKNISSNGINDLEQNLHYFPNQGFSIESIQKVALSDKQLLKIDIEYLK